MYHENQKKNMKQPWKLTFLRKDHFSSMTGRPNSTSCESAHILIQTWRNNWRSPESAHISLRTGGATNLLDVLILHRSTVTLILIKESQKLYEVNLYPHSLRKRARGIIDFLQTLHQNIQISPTLSGNQHLIGSGSKPCLKLFDVTGFTQSSLCQPIKS